MSSMELFEAMHTQQSARGYTDEPVSDAHVQRILEAATWAPNAGNRQLWEFIVVRDPDVRRQVAVIYRTSMALLADSLPSTQQASSGQAGSEEAPLSGQIEEAYVSASDPRTAPRSMLRWSANLAQTLQDVPVLIVVGYDRSGMPYSWDGIFRAFAEETVYTGVMPAVQNLMLAARGLGLGTCLTTVANVCEGKLKDLLGVPQAVQLVALIPLGYPTEPFRPRRRMPAGEKTHHDRW